MAGPAFFTRIPILKNCSTASLIIRFVRFFTSNCPDDTVKENNFLLQNLSTLGVDIKMVRRRQPGILRKQITNENGLVSFLKSKGAEDKTVASIISRYPRSITRSHDYLEKRWLLWRSVFKNDSEIIKIIKRSPESFFRSSDNNNLEKNIAYLCSLGLTSKDLHRLLTTAPRTFSNSLELNQQMVEFLQDIGCSLGGKHKENFAKQIISKNVYILIRSTKRVKANIDFLQDVLHLNNEELLHLLQGSGSEILDLSNEYIKRNFKSVEEKLDLLGCTNEQTTKFIIKYPLALYVSSGNLNNKINCLLEGGITINQILEKPKVLDFSFENIKGRLKTLEEIGYNFKENGISVLDCSRTRFEVKINKLTSIKN
uniref:Mitochondrial transcription termination factor 1 n=1 Tax=Erpetoichthys calabaricus TaxID=27687 RepID=A0A8C4STM2_ERPCA